MINKTKFSLIIILFIAAVSITGCTKKECETNSDCPAGNCNTAECRDKKCVYISISDCCGNETCETGESYSSCAADCPSCDDNNKCTTDSYDYHERQCVNAPNLNDICCGNTVCEPGETYTTCMRDCPDCDDGNKCTNDKYDYPAQKCINEVITPCCGNETCDQGAEEYSSCPADCPDCDDKSRLTADSFNYTTQKCENPVTHYFIDDFEEGTKNWIFHPDALFTTIVEDGNTVLKETGISRATINMDGWDNYGLKFRFKKIDGSLSANFRHYCAENGCIRYSINISGQVINLNKEFIGGGKTVEYASFKISEDWHTLEIRGYGNILNIYIDDNLLIKYKDTENPVLSGGAAFETHEGSEFLIDDVEIKVIAPEDVVYP